jgi:AcrR family transcriptional regulator
MKPKDEKKIRQIFSATLKLVHENGLAGITMGEIARAARIATGTLYIYFKNKNDLINALFTDCRKNAVNIYFKNYNESDPFKKGFRVIWLNLLKFRMEHFEQAVFVDQCHHSPFITETTKEITRKMIQPLYKLVERGKKEGLLKDWDNTLLLTFMVGGINEFIKYSKYSGKKISRPQIEQMFQLCWDALKV